eukprot:g22988.t1
MLRGCLLSIIYTTCLDLCFAEGAGSFECPCISSRSAGFASLQQQLIARGMERDYGTQGCRAYDDADSASPCGTGEGGECQSSWCYVDMDACLQNETACVAAGGVLGSYDSEHCRTRLTMASTLNLSAFFSYETCGYVNTYNDSTKLFETVAGKSKDDALLAIASRRLFLLRDAGQAEGGNILGSTGAAIPSL